MIIIDETVAAIADNTRHAGRRRPKRQYGRALTIALALAACALFYFGARAI